MTDSTKLCSNLLEDAGLAVTSGCDFEVRMSIKFSTVISTNSLGSDFLIHLSNMLCDNHTILSNLH